jgi:hypothetical protein
MVALLRQSIPPLPDAGYNIAVSRRRMGPRNTRTAVETTDFTDGTDDKSLGQIQSLTL